MCVSHDGSRACRLDDLGVVLQHIRHEDLGYGGPVHTVVPGRRRRPHGMSAVGFSMNSKMSHGHVDGTCA